MNCPEFLFLYLTTFVVKSFFLTSISVHSVFLFFFFSLEQFPFVLSLSTHVNVDFPPAHKLPLSTRGPQRGLPELCQAEKPQLSVFLRRRSATAL